MMRSWWLTVITLTFIGWTSPTKAGNVSEQFSRIQQLQLPLGGPLVESKVFVDRGRMRIETFLNGHAGFGPGLGLSLTAQILLIHHDQKVIYFLDPSLKQAKRADFKHPFPLMVPGYLHVAYLVQDEIMGYKMTWTKLADESIDGQQYELYRVSGIPQTSALIHLSVSSKLPRQVAFQFDSIITKPMKWIEVSQGPQAEELFTVPPDYQISDIPLPPNYKD